MLTICTSFEPDMFEMDWLDIKDKPLWILGKSYSPAYDFDVINKAVRSRIWFTYRKKFACIEGTGPSSDQGWGCMLRCGQMMLAHALVRRHLGPDWMWSEDEENATYQRILRMFQDKKTCLYSIHQIAQMGVSEGKPIGEWFGPNTIAHVLKKLSIYDEWSSLAIHIAMDSVVIRDDITRYCHIAIPHPMTSLGSSIDPAHGSELASPVSQSQKADVNEIGNGDGKCGVGEMLSPGFGGKHDSVCDSNYDFVSSTTGDFIDGCNGPSSAGSGNSASISSYVVAPGESDACGDGSPSSIPTVNPPRSSTITINQIDGAMMHCSESFDTIPSLLTSPVAGNYERLCGRLTAGLNWDGNSSNESFLNNDPRLGKRDLAQGAWRPLLLIVPLRLGLTTLNPVYIPAIKEFFMLKQCLGIIGGRPNHALYFIGIVGEELIYLDPHDCQLFVDLDEPPFQDTSYHCDLVNRIAVRDIDPSLALAFYCQSELEFKDLCQAFENSLLLASQPPLFELMQAHPAHIPPFVPYTGERVARADFMMVEPQYDSDEEFEILS